MSLRRLGLVFRNDAAENARRPLIWILVLILAVVTWGLSSGSMRIASGGSQVGGTKAWITSEFANAQAFSYLVLLFYLFFIAIAAGMAIVRDDERKVGELLHATPLRPGEYVWGKFFACLATFVCVLGLHILFMMFFNHALPNPEAVEIRGPLHPAGYLRSALAFALPTIVFVTGTCFAIGERTRNAIVVFVLPLAVFLLSAFFLWEWSPTWLDPRINRALMLVDPTGFRWLNETWLRVDRGVEFYNTGRVGFDAVFLLSRGAFVAFGLLPVAWSARRFEASLRGEARPAKRGVKGAVAAGIDATPGDAAGVATAGLHDALLPGAPTAFPAVAASAGAMAPLPPAVPGRAPGLVRGAMEVARFELRELANHAGLYLFVPWILLQVTANVIGSLGSFDAPPLRTPGRLAVTNVNTLTISGCLILLIYTFESLRRERATGLGSIFYSTPTRTGSILLGKSIANLVVVLVILLAALVACLASTLTERKVPLDLAPFALTWGLLVLPTFLVWLAFLTFLYAATGSRNAALGWGLGALALTGFLRLTDRMNWAGNWSLWEVLRWSDLAGIEPNGKALLLNRLTVLSLAVLFSVWALRVFARRERDATLQLNRLRPDALARSALRLAPFAILPIAGIALQVVLVQQGFQGKVMEHREKDYWRRNLATWKGAPIPAIAHADIDLTLEPEARRFRVRGRYHLRNATEKTLRFVPVTPGFHWSDLAWTLNGDTCTPDDRSGLVVFTPPAPLAPGDSLLLGFTYTGEIPKGLTRNGAGATEFVLPSGIVLTSFGPAFVPTLGYMEDVGIRKENRYEPREYPDDFYVGITPAADRGGPAFTTRIRIRAPAEYTANSVGVLESDVVDGGTRTVTWVSDHPVRFFNVVAGRWAVRDGEGTKVFYDPRHAYNIPEIGEALDLARARYSEWFFPYPWQELKLSEFPGLADYAQGFATNITFSESIGFLTKSDPKTNLAYFVTAHEAAHQWWGNLLSPGEGPGADILSEGMAHFSTILLVEEGKGLRGRIEFCRRIEERYGDARVANAERPLVKIDGQRDGDRTVMYDKGGWAAWMLLNHMGREPALAGIREFLARYCENADHPALQDFLATMREFAPDPVSFDAFAKQWYHEVVVPQYLFHDAKREKLADAEGAWEVTLRVENVGTGTMPVEIAAARGERFPDPGKKPEAYEDARETITLGPKEAREVRIRTTFEPERVLVDPDALVLQLERASAIHRF